MRSRSSSVTTNNSGSVLTNDEIGISESSGGLGLSRAQELKLAIECLKKRVVEAETQHQLEQGGYFGPAKTGNFRIGLVFGRQSKGNLSGKIG